MEEAENIFKRLSVSYMTEEITWTVFLYQSGALLVLQKGAEVQLSSYSKKLVFK